MALPVRQVADPLVQQNFDHLDGTLDGLFPVGTDDIDDGAVTLDKLELRIVTGSVTSAGAINRAGTGGWTSVRTGVGLYTVTFTTAFSAIPEVMLTLLGATANACRVSALTASSFGVQTYTTGLVDSAFAFWAFGAR